MTKMNVENTLQQIGLNDREAKVYLASLELGESTVLPISKKAGIKRTYCYDILAELSKKNLVSYVEKNNRRRYVAEEPDKIIKILKERLENFNQILPDLKSIHNRSSVRPKVRFYEGKEGVISVYEQLLGVEEMASVASPEHITANFGDFFVKFAEKMLAKKVKARELIARSGQDIDYIKKYKVPYQEARLLPKDIKLTTDMIIFENKLAMISYSGEIHALVIESSGIVDTQKVLFEILWQKAEKML